MHSTNRQNGDRGPGGGDTSRGGPQLVTQEEAICLLRLDALNLRRPKEALRHLRRTRQIAYVKVCGKILFPRQALDDYLKRHLVNEGGAPLD